MQVDLDKPPVEDECWQFIYDALAGVFMTSGKIRQLCAILAKRGTTYKIWHYDPDAAQRAVSFIERFCCQTSGDIGQRLVLQPFQRFVVATIFGWVDDDGNRQYQEVLMVLGRKNGKTVLAAAVMQYLLVADGEYGPQIYTMACTESQAALCFGGAKKMMKQSPALSKRERMGTVPERRRQGILYDANDGYITTLTMNSELDGLDVHGAVCDEIAAWKTDGPYNDIKQGMSARSQPLMFEITTAGFVRNSIYDTQYAYASRWLNGELDDDRFIPFIWELDRDDDWMHDEDCWVKANPGLGTIKSVDTLRGFVQRAINEPTFRPTVLTKDFNIPQNSSSAWLTWEESGSDEKVDFESMGFRYAIVGFDYAQSVDLTCAQVLCMREGDEKFYERTMYWIPEAKLVEQETKGDHATKDHAPYRLWIDQGYMRVVPGNVVPVSVLAQFIQELRDEHGIYTFALGYDPWHVIGSDRELLEQMIGTDRCEAVIQGAKTLSDPMNRIRADYRNGRFVDNANPVNRWCRMNVMVTTDTNLNILPDKKEAKGANKIDGFMAELDAYIAFLRHEDEYRAMLR